MCLLLTLPQWARYVCSFQSLERKKKIGIWFKWIFFFVFWTNHMKSNIYKPDRKCIQKWFDTLRCRKRALRHLADAYIIITIATDAATLYKQIIRFSYLQNASANSIYLKIKFENQCEQSRTRIHVTWNLYPGRVLFISPDHSFIQNPLQWMHTWQ